MIPDGVPGRRVPLHRPAGFTTCFGCGPDNPRGLALDFFREGDSVVAELVPHADHGGFGRILHGGITAAAIDEALGWSIYGLLGKLGLTRRLEVHYERPLTCGAPCTVRGRVVAHDEREATVAVEVLGADGLVAARGSGTLRFVTARTIARLGGLAPAEGA